MFLKKNAKFKLLSCFLTVFIILMQINIQNVLALPSDLTLVSAVTDHIGKKIILTFDRPMTDPTGTQNQFTVAGTYTEYVSSTNKGTFSSGNIPVTSVALGSDSTQITLSMSTAIQTGEITLDYTKGSVQASDETQLQSFTAQSVTNNNICSPADMVDFDYDATEIGYDPSDPSNPILKYKYDKPVDYDNVQLAWYFYNGFFVPMVDNLNNYVKFYEKDTGNNVVLPNILTRPNSPATYKDGSTKNQQIVTDWYFWQLQHYAPLGLDLVSQSLKPSTNYVIEIDKGFKFNNPQTIQKTFSFEFTTTADSLTKPYWAAGSSVTTSNITENSLTLGWTAAQDNHKVTGYNIYKNGELLTTVDGDTTSYNVSSLSSGTEYKFKVEAVDFANNHSSDCIEATQVTSIAPVAPNVTNDDTANTVAGMAAGMEYYLDNAGYVPYDAAAFSAINFSGNHTLLVRVAAQGSNPAGAATTLTFTTNPPSWSVLSTLTAANVTENSLKLNWSAANDNVGVTSYKIFENGTLIGTVNGDTTTYDVTGLSPVTEYSFKIEAGNGAGKWSTTGPSTAATTIYTPSAASVKLESANSKLQIASDTVTESVSAKIYDQYNNIMPSQKIKWSVDGNPIGISISSEGLLTIKPFAAHGTITVKGIVDGTSISNTKQFEIEAPISQTAITNDNGATNSTSGTSSSASSTSGTSNTNTVSTTAETTTASTSKTSTSNSGTAADNTTVAKTNTTIGNTSITDSTNSTSGTTNNTNQSTSSSSTDSNTKSKAEVSSDNNGKENLSGTILSNLWFKLIVLLVVIGFGGVVIFTKKSKKNN